MALIQLLLVAGVAANAIPRQLEDGAVTPVCTRNTKNFVVDTLVGHPDRDDAGRTAYFPKGGDAMPPAFRPYAAGYYTWQHQSTAMDKNVGIKNICTTAMCIEPGTDDDSHDSDSDGNMGKKVWTKPGMSDFVAEMYQSINGIETGFDQYGGAKARMLLGVASIEEATEPWDNSASIPDGGSSRSTGCCLQRGADADCAYPLSKEQWYATCKPYLCFMETCGSARGNYYKDGVACTNDEDTESDYDARDATPECTFTVQASSVNANDGNDDSEKITNELKDTGQISSAADVKAGDTVCITADRRRLEVVAGEVYTANSSGEFVCTSSCADEGT